LSAGQNYYYATEDLTVQEIVDRINCVPQNRIRIMYLQPMSQVFYSWPQAVHNETVTLDDPNNLTVFANTTFIIQSKDETVMGEIYSVNEPMLYDSASTDNPFDPWSNYGIINYMGDEGWVSIAGISNGSYLTEYLNESDLIDRVEKIYSKNGSGINDFQEVEITNNVASNIDFSDEEYMLWMKLAEEQPEVLVPDCGGEDATHACITDGSNPAVFFQTGDEACVNCTGIEASNHNIDGVAADWISTGESCSALGQNFQHSGVVDTTNYAFRAICGNLEFNLELAPIEVEYYGTLLETNENFCTSSDETSLLKCVTTTGNETCSDLGKICSEIGIKNVNNPNAEYTYELVGGGCNLSIEEIYQYLDNNSPGFDWSINAICDSCSYGDRTHICMTTNKDKASTYGLMAAIVGYNDSGDSACGHIGSICSKLQTSSDGNTWIDGLDKEGGGIVQCSDYSYEAQQVYEDSLYGYIFPYLIRAECQ